MSGNNLLTNDNITNYLYKLHNYKAQTGLEGNSSTVFEKTVNQEPYGAGKIVLNKDILAEDIPFNLPGTSQIGYLDNAAAGITSSSWDTSVTNDISNQTISSYDLSNNDSTLSHLVFYKEVYLETCFKNNNPNFLVVTIS